MRLSVVIPTLNEAENVRDCVASAFALQPSWFGEIEVLVADGGSRDGTPALAAAAHAVVVEAAAGRGRQLRAGVAASTGEMVLMLHADTRLHASAGAQIRAVCVDGGAECGAFRQRIDATGFAYRLLEAGNAFRARRLGAPYGDQAIFVRRTLLDAVGGISDQPLLEDVELMRRLRTKSWPMLLDGPVVVSARRWRERGVVAQTLKNWSILAAYWLGVSPESLARWYRPRGAPSEDVT